MNAPISPKAPAAVLDSVETADDALARADTKELHVMFLRAREKNDKLLTAFNTMMEHYAGRNSEPRMAANTDAINAMKEVALSALELAKAVAAMKVQP